jgi:predicted RNA polymerase sigma factor
MLLHDSRREARSDERGDLVVLEEQDRGKWDRRQIAEALPLVEEALRGGPGAFALQAAIAALHCQAAHADETDWPQIVRLYDRLERLQPSPIVSLNRAVAIAMVDGPRAALTLVAALADAGDLDGYHLLHAARADLLRRLGALIRGRGELHASARAGDQRQRAPVSRAPAPRGHRANLNARFARLKPSRSDLLPLGLRLRATKVPNRSAEAVALRRHVQRFGSAKA